MAKYVIIGGGAAGFFAAKAIRKNDEQGDILVISGENALPYYRIRLTEAIETDEEADSLLIEKQDYYEKNRFTLQTNTKIDFIDFPNKEVVLDDGERVAYEKLLIASGAHPFVPSYEGGQKEGIFAMRTIEDLLSLRRRFPKIKTVLVVGGGILGLEAAHALSKKGFEVHVGEFSKHLLSAQLDSESGDFLQKKLEEEDGLHIHNDATLQEVIGDDEVTAVKLTNGEEFPCEAVVFSVGVRSNLDLAGDTLEKNRGIVVNEKLETSEPDVWAAGDVAEIGGRTMGLWSAAMEMGKIAGENMTGGDAAYDSPLLFTNLSIGNVKLFSAGSHDGDMERFDGEGDNFAKLFFSEDKLVGGILYGDVSKSGKLKKWVREGADKETVLQEFVN